MTAETTFSSRHFRLHRLADGVFAAIARTDSGGEVANAGFVDLGGAVAVFDAFLLPQAARDLRRAVWQLTGSPARYVVNSHYHADHVYGNGVFVPEATIVSTVGTRDLLLTRGAAALETWQTEGRARLEQGRREHEALTDRAARERLANQLTILGSLLAVVHQITLHPASLTCDAHLTLHGRTRTAEFITYGGGHTDSDGFLFLPADGILFAGDLIAASNHPGMTDANPEHWPDVLRRIQELAPTTVIPGHGPLAGPEAIADLLGYFAHVEALVRARVEAGATATELENLAVPAAYQAWEGSAFPANVQRFYRHLVGAETPEIA